MYICVHDRHMQYVRRRNDRTMLLHEIVEIVNHMDDVRRQLMQAFTMIHTHLQYAHPITQTRTYMCTYMCCLSSSSSVLQHHYLLQGQDGTD